MAEADMLEHRVNFMEHEVIPRMATAIDKMSDSLQRLTSIDERQSEFKDAVRRAFNEIKDRKDEIQKLDERLRQVELALPTLMLIKNWVIMGVIGTVGLFLIAAAVIIFHLPVH